jgi:LAS superfamily LD-carboxypeptidase LdcB
LTVFTRSCRIPVALLLAVALLAVAPAPAGAAPLPMSRLTSVRGIVVHKAIDGRIEALLAAAEADGILLSGSGYRDPATQIMLRRAHCGTSHYAIYEMPSSECVPPTARPGTSMHEKGRAIDFTWQGLLITSHSSPAYQWLAANAARYRLYNLPSEPWHWSTNGH